MQIICPICNHEFKDDEEIDLDNGMVEIKDGGECPKCKAQYTFDNDYDGIGGVLIADFDYYYLTFEEKKIEQQNRLQLIENQSNKNN